MNLPRSKKSFIPDFLALLGLAACATLPVTAVPEASILNLTPATGAVVATPEVVVTGKITHDVYPAGRIMATLNGAPLSLDPDGRFNARVPLQPGANNVVVRATTPNPRQQTTLISTYIDASMVYGSDDTRAAALRTFVGGALKTSPGNLLPFNTAGLENANDAHFYPDKQLFLAGDIRANENVELIAIHTLFLREHNQLAAAIAAANPRLTDEQVYQRARRLVTAEVQAITVQEFLPALLGRGALRPYPGYNADVNPGLANEFSTAAFRIGHTLINDDIEFLNNDAEELRDGLPLAMAFFNPAPVVAVGPDPLLKYLASDNAQEVDTQLVDGLRDFLFGPPGAGGLDLAALNIQRGRDHGLADYNTVRVAYGLPPVLTFAQITANAGLQGKLASLYGSVNSLDLWVAGLAEDHLPGSSVGPTFSRIIARQFERIRDGDRNWYEAIFSGRQLAAIRATRLSDIIRRNTAITKLQDEVFFYNPDTTLASLTARAGSLPRDLYLAPEAPFRIAALTGAGNNDAHPAWGAAGAELVRFAPAAYTDGVASPSGVNRPSARAISNEVAVRTATAPNDRLMSSFVYGWGQFLDHDIGLTAAGTEALPISVPAGDPSFDPLNTGRATIPFTRSKFSAATGKTAPGESTQVLKITYQPPRKR